LYNDEAKLRWYLAQIIEVYVLSVGTRATVPCEPCQVRKEAALSDVHGVPRASLAGAYTDIVCIKYQRFLWI